MLAIGDVVEATVTDVREFGLFCSSNGQELLLLIPDISWIATFNSCEQFAEPGDVLTVKILNIEAASGKIAATIKGRHPNPWETGVLEVGTRHSARVVRYVPNADRCQDGPGYLVEVVPGAFAMLCATDRELIAGDRVAVVIQESTPEFRAVRLALR
jgi:predicted RNA-binding protein with RPS1 domain